MTTATATMLSAAATKFRDRILSYLPFRAFTWLKLPLAAFAGLRVKRDRKSTRLNSSH